MVDVSQEKRQAKTLCGFIFSLISVALILVPLHLSVPICGAVFGLGGLICLLLVKSTARGKLWKAALPLTVAGLLSNLVLIYYAWALVPLLAQ